jgi:hypothetical protein
VVRRGLAGFGRARQAGHGTVWRVLARRGLAGRARLGSVWPGVAGRGTAWQAGLGEIGRDPDWVDPQVKTFLISLAAALVIAGLLIAVVFACDAYYRG